MLCDKRDALPFSIVYMPHLDNNIPSNTYYASLGSEMLWFARTSCEIFKANFNKNAETGQ